MGCKSYEFDKSGKITIYPSLYTSRRKSPGLLLKVVKKLGDMVSGKKGKDF